MPEASPALLGCDFSSSPSARKPIVIAWGECQGPVLRLLRCDSLPSLSDFSDRLSQTPAWLGGFDLPFGLPRELVETLGWPTDYQACIAHFAALSREDIRRIFQAFCNARPAGGKFAHRATDGPARSSPSMKWVNPPVAFMLQAGVPRLLALGAHLPGLREQAPGQCQRVALEAYPGLIAKATLGARSYKSDTPAQQTTERFIARKDLLHALETGQARMGSQPLDMRLRLSDGQRDTLLADGKADTLDAVLCLMQAAWAWRQHEQGAPRYGLPEFDPLEGWIVGA